MKGCFGVSLIELKQKHTRAYYRSHGLRPSTTKIDEYTTMHCWLPNPSKKAPKNPKPSLLLIHGFGGNGILSWEHQIASLTPYFNLYVPDLVGFGLSSTCSPKVWSEDFQAECLFKLMGSLGVVSVTALVGHSYGGFVAYKLASMFPEFAPRVVIVSSGVCMKPNSNDPVLREYPATHMSEVLLPTSVANTRKTVALSIHNVPSWLPDCFYADLMESMIRGRENKLRLLDSIILGTVDAPPLPKINQEVLIVWGEYDRIFNISLAYDLKGLVGRKAELVILKNCGHVPLMEKPKEFNKVLKQFLTKSPLM